MKPVIIHSAARAELDDAMAFYEGRALGLGLDLAAMVESAIGMIQKTPELWPPYKRGGFRMHVTRRFPFVIYYLELPDSIWIVAIAHGSRRPDYWRRRKLEQ